jgi:hypothetical protein
MEEKLLAGQGRQETRAKLSHFYGLDQQQRQDTPASTPAAQVSAAVPKVSPFLAFIDGNRIEHDKDMEWSHPS